MMRASAPAIPTTAILAALLATTALPATALAQAAGVSALVQQGRYWQSKGRQDLANQAFRRALALDPKNADARRGLAGPAQAQTPNPAPRPAPATAKPGAKAPPTPAATAPKAAPAAATGDDARAAGFRALDRGQLNDAQQQFARAIARNGSDADATGGLGLVRLRQERFGDARDLLDRASRLGGPAKWAQALASARFYAGLADARALLAKGSVADAQTQAQALVRSGFAQKGPALELLAETYERQGRYADAADTLAQAGEGADSAKRLDSRATRDRALQAAARGDDAGAEREFQAGLLLDRNDPWIRYEFARHLIAKGRQPEAESLITSLSALGTPDSLYAAALLTADRGRLAAAQALIERVPENQRSAQMRGFAIGLKTDSDIVRAKALAAQGQTGQALVALRQLGSAPALPPVKQAAVADALYELGDTDGAAALAQRALAGEIPDVAGYEPVVRVLAKTGRDAFANAAIERAAPLAGNSADGQLALARLNGIMTAAQADRMRLSGQYAQAFDLLQAAWNAAPGNRDILAELALLYQSGGLHAQGAQTYQLILTQSPRDKTALTGLIETAGAAGNATLARDAVTRAIRAFPDDYEIYMAAARMERARGDDRAALRYLKRAQVLYAGQSGLGAGRISAANPFAATVQGNNPFSNRAPSPALASAPAINPFALGSGAVLPVATAPAFAPAPANMSAPRGSTPFYDQPAYGFAPKASAPFAALPASGDQGFADPFGGLPTGLPAPAYPSAAYAPAAPGTGDPVLDDIRSDIDALSRDSGPRADIRTGYRQRSGEAGLSMLREVTGSAEISTGAAGGRVAAKAEAVVLDGGRPTGSALARFGYNGTAEAQGIVDQLPSELKQAQTQHAAGVALSASYQSTLIDIDVGSTPLGFDDVDVTWRAAVKPRLSPDITMTAWTERKPVTDSIVSYAGTRDPVTGYRWGQVMRIGGGASFSYDHDGAGVYADAAYNRYSGVAVRDNRGIQMNVGGYMPLLRGTRSSLVAGVNVNYQDFANNQNFFTYGHGGYFSPQSFLSISFPIRYAYADDRIEARASIAPGYQSYNQDQVPLYPTDPLGQSVLDGLKARNDDVRSFYDSISKTGFALSADGSFYYRLSPSTRVGGEISINTFGTYDEFKSLIGIRQILGNGR